MDAHEKMLMDACCARCGWKPHQHRFIKEPAVQFRLFDRNPGDVQPGYASSLVNCVGFQPSAEDQAEAQKLVAEAGER